MANKAVFLDRDHTIIDDPGYLSDPDQVKLLPGVELALKSLRQAGYLLVVVTNQSGVARGMFTEQTLKTIHAELQRRLEEKGARLDAIYYCPFHPEAQVEKYAKDSELRKPKPGMLLKAAEDLDIDLSASWMVGDSPRDVEAGQRAGTRTVRIRHPGEQLPRDQVGDVAQPDYTVRNLVDAARVIIREGGRQPTGGIVSRAMHNAHRENGQAQVTASNSDGATDPPAGQADSSQQQRRAPASRLGLSAETDEQPLAGSQAPVAADETPPTPPAEAMDQPVANPASHPGGEPAGRDDDPSRSEALLEHIYQELTLLTRNDDEQLSYAKIAAGLVMMLAVLALGYALVTWYSGRSVGDAQFWATAAAGLQLLSLTLYVMNRAR